MMQLSYQSAFDPYHSMFRFFQILELIERKSGGVPIDKIRIVDFFLTFPHRLEIFSFKQTHSGFRRVAKAYKKIKPYGDNPYDVTLFGRMEQIQRAALSTLAAEGFVDKKLLLQDVVLFTEKAIPTETENRIKAFREKNKDLINVLAALLNEYELGGHDGLKKRSSLMEYRYDVI